MSAPARENEDESSPHGGQGMNRSPGDDEDGERELDGDRESGRATRGEKEATAGTHSTFDLFK